MSNPERPASQPGPQPPDSAELAPLPPDLAAFLRDKPFAAMLHGSDHGTVLLIKAPAQEIRSARGRVPIQLRHELYAHPAAPVIRTVLRIYDRPDAPLAFEAFTNVADAEQRGDFAALAAQPTTLLLFYDEQLRHCFSKQMASAPAEVINGILADADRRRAAIPDERFDFDRAKREVMERTAL